MQNDVNCCDISLYKILIGVGGVGHGWVGWGGSWRGGVGHTGVGWGGSWRGGGKHDYKMHIYHDHQKFS